MALLCIVFVVSLLCSQAAAEGPTPLFMDYIHPRPDAAQPSYREEEVETETLCFRGAPSCAETCYIDNTDVVCGKQTKIAFLACADCSTGSSSYGDSTHGPDARRHRSMQDIMMGPETVGKCIYTQHASSPIPLADKPVEVMGTFTGTCYIHDEAYSCASPSCNNVVLTVTGVIYKVANAVVDGSLSDAGEYCDNRQRRTSKAALSLFASKHKASTSRAGPGSGTDQLLHGPAYIYVGPFTVVSPHHAASRFSRGILQHSLFESAALGDAAALQALPRLSDDVFKLKLVADGMRPTSY